MVRTLIFVSAVLALIATVSAAPVVNAQAGKTIGIDELILENVGNGILRIHDNDVHNVANRNRILKRDEAGGTPIRVMRAIGVRGNKMMANAKENKGTSPKQ